MFAIIAGAFVPLNFLAVRLAADATCTRACSARRAATCRATMALTFLVALAAMALLFVDAVEVRDGRQARARAAARAAAHARRRGAAASRRARRAAVPARSPMPALPLDEAGKYVAGAYVVFVALILIYVAIMARGCAHRARAGELTSWPSRRPTRTSGPTEPVMSELLALGISHKTAPVALRERVALPDGRRPSFLRERRRRRRVHEAVAISTCNRTEIYLVVGDPVEAETRGARDARPPGRHPPDRAGRGRSTRCATATRRATSTA